MRGDASRSSVNIFDRIYNSPDAKGLFTVYYNTIDARADFFGASNQYEKNLGSGAKWFGGAESVSRAPLTGLGADGNASGYTFLLGSVLAGWNAKEIYDWRAAAGNALMNSGFDKFSSLYNSGTNNPVIWDISQLISEQKTLQSIHEKYVSDKWLFTTFSNVFTNTNIPTLGPGNNPLTTSQKGMPSGINILDYKSRVQYGCTLLDYSASQGCTP